MPISRGILVVVATLAAAAIPTDSFVLSPSKASYQTSELKVFDATSSSSSSDGDESISTNRRTALLTGISLAAGYFGKDAVMDYTSPAILSTLDSTATAPVLEKVFTVEQALNMIESQGDKRFLHAVVASDYQFLYEQSKTVPSEIDAKAIFSKKVSTAQTVQVELAATGSLRTPKAPSLWPLGESILGESDVHYAWPEQGGKLQPSATSSTQAMIVDGIDCGKMALEDALEGDMQVLVQAPTYLVVPHQMEASLRKGLQEAFLI